MNADTVKLNRYVDEPATRLISSKTHSRDEFKNLMKSFPEKIMNISFILFHVKTSRYLSNFYEITALLNMATYQECS